MVRVEGDEEGDTIDDDRDDDDEHDDNYDNDEGAEEEKNEEECFLCGDQSTCILQEQVKLPEEKKSG